MAGRRPRAEPHERVKADRRVLSPDERWAAEIRDRILADCHPFQRAAVEDPSRRVSILAGRGGAKTTTLRCRAAIKLTSIREAEILFFARTKGHAKKLYWNPLQRMNEHYGLKLRFKESEQTATCTRTGSVITIKGMEDDSDIEIHRGYPFNEVQVDEAASHPVARVAKLKDEIIGPRLGERGGCFVLAGTAGFDLKGDFYDATFPGSKEHARYADRGNEGYEERYWSSHYWTAKMVYELPRARHLYPAIVANWEEALLEKTKKDWSDDSPIWLREYIAQWAANDTNMVFHYRPELNQWDPFDGAKLEGIQGLVIALAKLRETGLVDLRFVYGGDMGTALPYALNIFAFSPKDAKRGIWHVMFFERTGMHARPIAELHMGPEAAERAFLHQPAEPYAGALGVTGWPDAQVMDTDLATLAELTNTYGLPYKKAEKNPHYKKGAIELTNGDLIDSRIHVIKGSPLEDQLMSLQWRENRFGHVEEDQRQASHSSDTLVYGRKEIAGLFESGAVEQEAVPGAPGPPQPVTHREPGIYSQPAGGGLSTTRRPVDPWRKL
jgi:hypothetical protein